MTIVGRHFFRIRRLPERVPWFLLALLFVIIVAGQVDLDPFAFVSANKHPRETIVLWVPLLKLTLRDHTSLLVYMFPITLSFGSSVMISTFWCRVNRRRSGYFVGGHLPVHGSSWSWRGSLWPFPSESSARTCWSSLRCLWR